MAEEVFRIQTITQLHEGLGFDKPKHPLISVIDATKFKIPEEMYGVKTASDFYMIALKDGNCGMQYGRNYYDFEEGVLTFTAPGQVMTATAEAKMNKGWMLFFHPDIIRGSNLSTKIDNYTFFDYEVHEALHISAEEERILNDCVAKIEYEYNHPIDDHSQNLFASNIELLLNYCLRFYGRQFNTRTNQHKDVVSHIEGLIKAYFKEGLQLKNGPLTPTYLAEKVHKSPGYLSDLLKKETGKNTKDHINDFIVELAKNKLLGSDQNVNEIAYDLGFNYPHYFSRLFKQKTGLTPNEYREKAL